MFDFKMLFAFFYMYFVYHLGGSCLSAALMFVCSILSAEVGEAEPLLTFTCSSGKTVQEPMAPHRVGP